MATAASLGRGFVLLLGQTRIVPSIISWDSDGVALKRRFGSLKETEDSI